MSRTTNGLSRRQILSLLDEMSSRAHSRGIRIEMFLVGGAAMVLAYNTARTTKDIKGIFEPKMVAYDIAAEIAKDSSFGLSDGWFNDAVKTFPFPGNQVDEAAKVFYDGNGLILRVASPRYLFAMKAWSGRESDEEDLRTLWPLCGYGDAAECLYYIERAYPSSTLRPRVQYVVEDIAATAPSGPRHSRSTLAGPVSPGSSLGGHAVDGVPSTDDVWVRPHTRNGHHVRGHWRHPR